VKGLYCVLNGHSRVSVQVFMDALKSPRWRAFMDAPRHLRGLFRRRWPARRSAPDGRIPAGSWGRRVAQLGAYLAANGHSLPATPSLIEPDNARSNGSYSHVQHHPATLRNRLMLKQVARDRLSPLRYFVFAMAEAPDPR
jgi:hypothetical protein